MFLLKVGLDKETFIATGVMLAVLVDMSRMLIYGWKMIGQSGSVAWPLVLSVSLSAFAGAYFSTRLLKKITIRSVQITVSVLLVMVSLGLISGVL